ncbi:MAG: glutamate-5-semialdehyde dehydrogenase [Nocardioidaceae bacterium]|nr:glutamate-5-semialdehyde dehydrogenase [Nocardioidaceae bacterium]
MSDTVGRTDVAAAARAARVAARLLARLPRADKDRGLHAMAQGLLDAETEVLAANADDVSAAEADGTAAQLVDRLRLDHDRLSAMAAGLRKVADLPDPVGEVVRGVTLPNGLELRQRRVPLGVIGIIYEARPNVTADAAGLCLKAGNAVLLRGSGSAARTNAAIVAVLRDALSAADLPADAVTLLDASSRATATELMRARGLVDLVVPRGGAGLIRTVVEQSTVPVVETGVGNCHVYVDADADLDMARAIVLNAKTHRPSVCNAAESLLVHEAVADKFVPDVVALLRDHGVTVHGDEVFQAASADVLPVSDDDHATEFCALEMSARVVIDLDDALDHVARFGTGHTEAIVTGSLVAARRFTEGVDAAAVMVNASTRFTDGEEFGLGAEIGISTQKLHARGPMGLAELTTTTTVVTGDGHLR